MTMTTDGSNSPPLHNRIEQLRPTPGELYRASKKLGVAGRRMLERVCAGLYQLEYAKYGNPVHITVGNYAAYYEISLDTAMAEMRKGIEALHQPGKLRKTQKKGGGDSEHARYCEIWFSWVDSIQLDSGLLNQITVLKKEARKNKDRDTCDVAVSVWVSKDVHSSKHSLFKKIKNDSKIVEPAPLSFKRGVKSIDFYADTLREICRVFGSDHWDKCKIKTKEIKIDYLHEKMQSCYSYRANFKDFRRNILEPAIQLLNDKREKYRATLSMQPIKTGRKVTSILFIVSDIVEKDSQWGEGPPRNNWDGENSTPKL